MTHRAGILATLLVLAAPLAAAQKPSAEEAELKRLAGDYRRVAHLEDGVALDVKAEEELRLVIEASGRVTLTDGPKVVRASTVVLDVKPTPRAMDITFTDGPLKGRTVLAIYDLRGKTYRVCWAPPGRRRPATFDSKKGSGVTLITYRRVQR